jgi:diadenylate cyclase
MPDTINDLIFQLRYLLNSLGPANVIDILLVAAFFFIIFQALRQTRATQTLYGVIVMLIGGLTLFLILPLATFRLLLGGLLLVALIALPSLFQQELRQAFIRLSRLIQWGERSPAVSDPLQIALLDTATSLSNRLVGALIVLEGQTALNDVIETGIPVHAGRVTTELLTNIFHPNAPLHDGAAVIRQNQLAAAACILPVARENVGDQHLGTRHRAALGLATDVPDALVIVVSEETGTISVAYQGELHRGLNKEQLNEWIQRFRSTPEQGARSPWQVIRDVPIRVSLPNVGLALFLAFFAWMALTYQTNPPQRLEIRNIPVTVLPPDDLIIVGSDIPDQINIEVQTSQEASLRLGTESVLAQLDLSQLASGSHRVSIQVEITDPDTQLVSINPATVDVVLERLIEVRLIPITLISDLDSLAFGYNIGDITVAPGEILVRGPESQVAQVAEARLVINLSGRRTFIQEVLEVHLIDPSGNRVFGLTPEPEQALVSVPIERSAFAREIPVQAQLQANLAEGFEVAEIRIVPANVTLIGSRTGLEETADFVQTTPIDLSNVRSTFISAAPLELPAGLTAVDENGTTLQSVQVEIVVQPITTYLVIQVAPELLFEVPFDSIVWAPETVTVLVLGPVPLLEQVQENPALLRISANLNGLDVGTHQVPLVVQAPEDLIVELFPAEIQVTIE